MILSREPGSMSRKNCRSARVRAGTSARSQPQAALVVPVLSIAYTMWIPFGIGSRIQYTLGPLPSAAAREATGRGEGSSMRHCLRLTGSIRRARVRKMGTE